MKRICRAHKAKSILCGVIAIVLSGCAGHIPRPVAASGDQVLISYTCRFPSGELAATTDKIIHDASSLSRSSVYLPGRFSPRLLTAGAPLTGLAARQRAFEDEILVQLAARAVGLQEGDNTAILLRGDLMPELSPADRYFKIAKVRTRDKELRISKQEYVSRVGQEPAVGQRFTVDPAFPGTIAEVTDNEVVVTFPLPPDGVVQTPFGKGLVKDAGNHYEIDIDAHIGTLVRTGGIIGRIQHVDPIMITIDYGYPFGGESLACMMKIESVIKAKPETATATQEKIEK